MCARTVCVCLHVAIPAALGTTNGTRGRSCVAIQLPSHGAAWPPKNYLCNIRNQSRPQDRTFSLARCLALRKTRCDTTPRTDLDILLVKLYIFWLGYLKKVGTAVFFYYEIKTRLLCHETEYSVLM